MLPSSLRPFLCRHDWFWSERRQSEVCRRCDAARKDSVDPSTLAWPLETLLVDEEDAVHGRPPSELGEWDIPVLPGRTGMARPPRGAETEEERRLRLIGRLDRLATGRPLTHAETVEVVLALIEDGHSSDPQVFGEAAAEQFARLFGATR